MLLQGQRELTFDDQIQQFLLPNELVVHESVRTTMDTTNKFSPLFSEYLRSCLWEHILENTGDFSVLQKNGSVELGRILAERTTDTQTFCVSWYTSKGELR